MKYIRTKDGRIFYAKKKSKKDVKFANDNLHWEAIPKGCDDYFTLDYEDDEIIAQADTIEELIDEWVCVKNHKETPMLVYLFSTNKKHKDDDIYGAIWVFDDNGVPTLKPVAKMKGVLPNGEIDWELL